MVVFVDDPGKATSARCEQIYDAADSGRLFNSDIPELSSCPVIAEPSLRALALLVFGSVMLTVYLFKYVPFDVK